MAEFLQIFTNPDALREYVSDFGVFAPVIFMCLQFLQVIVSPVPGNVTTLAGAAMFGFWKGFLFSYSAVTLGSCFNFIIAKKLGDAGAAKLAGKKAFEKYKDIFKDEKSIPRLRKALFLIMLLPFFPDDLVCLLAGLTPLKFREFLIIIAIARPWGLAFASLVGSGAWGLFVNFLQNRA